MRSTEQAASILRGGDAFQLTVFVSVVVAKGPTHPWAPQTPGAAPSVQVCEPTKADQLPARIENIR